MRPLAILLALFSAGCGHAGESVAFFGIHLTAPGATVEEEARRDRLEQAVRDRFAAEGYELLDLAPVAKDLDRVTNPARCYGCDQRMATKLGADFILVGEVQKVSEALLGILLQLRATETGATVKGGMVEIRGNTDVTWDRGMRSLLNNRLFREETR